MPTTAAAASRYVRRFRSFDQPPFVVRRVGDICGDGLRSGPSRVVQTTGADECGAPPRRNRRAARRRPGTRPVAGPSPAPLRRRYGVCEGQRRAPGPELRQDKGRGRSGVRQRPVRAQPPAQELLVRGEGREVHGHRVPERGRSAAAQPHRGARDAAPPRGAGEGVRGMRGLGRAGRHGGAHVRERPGSEAGKDGSVCRGVRGRRLQGDRTGSGGCDESRCGIFC
mmetsp:Transcript_58632/g.174531  ORF Transcript_58632/g.174531 Transcript_58632/m.174531 type:complete len:225 (+) Transcript_58632:35-709(+)